MAWLTTGCPEANLVAATVVHVADADGTGGWTRELDQQSLVFVAGFIGDAVVVAGWRDPVRLVPETDRSPWSRTCARAVDTHGTLVAGQESVVDTATGTLLWHTPRTSPALVQPGRTAAGRHAAPRHRPARRADRAHVLATLPKRLDRVTWEDDRHLLAVTWAKGRRRWCGSASTVTPCWSARRDPCHRRLPYRYVFETQP